MTLPMFFLTLSLGFATAVMTVVGAMALLPRMFSKAQLERFRHFIEMLILLGLLIGVWWLMYAFVQYIHPLARIWS